MQIRYYIIKVKDVYEEVLKEVTSDLQKCYIKVLKALEKYFKN